MSYQQKWYVNAPVNRANLLIINNKMLPLIQEQKIKNKNKFLGMHSPAPAGPDTPPAPLAPVRYPSILNPHNMLQYYIIITF